MWTFVLHEAAWHFSDPLQRAGRERLTQAMRELARDPFRDPEREFKPLNDRTYPVITLRGFQLTYWLDLRVKQVVIVAIHLL